MKFDKLLVLDIDETLVYATEKPLSREADFQLEFGKNGIYHVYKRPGLEDFLRNCFQRFEVGVWTSAGSDYALAIMKELIKDMNQLSFLWSYKHCNRSLRFNMAQFSLFLNLWKSVQSVATSFS